MRPLIKKILPVCDFIALFLLSVLGAAAFGIIGMDNKPAPFDPLKSAPSEPLLLALGLVILTFLAAALTLDFFRSPKGKGRFLLALLAAGLLILLPALLKLFIGGYAVLRGYAYITRL